MTSEVAYQGEPGAFGEMACLAALPDWKPVAHESFEAVADAVAAGRFQRGMIPVENSNAGPVPGNLEMIASKNVTILSRHALPVAMHCLGLPGARLEDIRLVRSHPMAIKESRRFLCDLGAATEESRNTAMAAHRLTETGDATVAVLASSRSAEIYGLEFLARDVQDSADNTTFFAMIAPR
ncbi:prephenate dehydratase domain-containing protein [Novosphingopyxis sp. YJ-S2-01]|mgnify:CR=1 FL=1|uniref:prephenate dehydratase domain-containing protein n=1 Tax=Novosphingopyxis sp. YJ-S2-01 TaxID=2794021 RepID=UPI0018DBC1CE|nr:prephenate dehydratase domain-containing protein [Novosphingopyxis sp. YJ-S2-01]MBH9538786.1 prephenate dehydratase [Novosphingopyxis sp. YJ-S2-01]